MQNAAHQASAVAIRNIGEDSITVQTSTTRYNLLLRPTGLDTPGGKNRFLVKGQQVERVPILASFYGANIIVDVPSGFRLASAKVTGDGNHPTVTLAFTGMLNGEAASYTVDVRFYNETRTCI